MTTEMAAADWILALILGGILGMLGQGIRVVIGLKKMNDQASQEGLRFGDLFQASTLGLSLLIGFIAGALAMIGITDTTGNKSLEGDCCHASGCRLRRNGFHRGIHKEVSACKP